MDAIKSANYLEPSPIQRVAVPVGLSNRDIVGIAETGSGKTAAFLLPLLCYVMRQPKLIGDIAQDGPYAIVMAPARELAQQIHQEAEKFGSFVGVRSVCIVGGQSVHSQAFSMSSGVEIVIATPGRLFDLIQQRLLVLNQCNYIVLDEADRMLDMGFEPQIQSIMDSMPSTNLRPMEDNKEHAYMTARGKGGAGAGAGGDGDDSMEDNTGVVIDGKHYRQTIMFSATMPFKVEQLAKKYLRDPVFVAIGSKGKVSVNVEQKIEWHNNDNSKKNRLISLLSSEYQSGPIIIFCNQKRTCDYISSIIRTECRKHTVSVVHGGKSQDQREAGLSQFKDGKSTVLVTTDVMGRGIDVTGVKLVINYELPRDMQCIERYTHRIGRTGRAGVKGVAISFINDDDVDIMYDLKRLLQESKSHIPNQLSKHPAAKNSQHAKGGEDILW
jgi:ATP-dependent RNA helicase DDX23/PRP28